MGQGGSPPPEGVSGKFWGRKREEKEGRKGKKEGKKKEEGEKRREKEKKKGKGKERRGKVRKIREKRGMRKKVNGENFWLCPLWQPAPVTPLTITCILLENIIFSSKRRHGLQSDF